MNCCEFCKATSPSYVCPRCKLNYCSLSCYKCDDHISCSEEFYRGCVEAQMEHQKVDESGKKKMKEALVRERRVTFEDALESRLASVNLDDSDEVLKTLTDEERHTFERLVESHEIARYISVWKPWWTQAKALVQEVNADGSAGAQHDLDGFKRQRRVDRPKIGGRKVKHLSAQTTEKNHSIGEDELSAGTKRVPGSDPVHIENKASSNDLSKIELKSVERENAKSVCRMSPIECIEHRQRERKTRIIDARHRSRLTNATCTNGEAMDNVHKSATSELNIPKEKCAQNVSRYDVASQPKTEAGCTDCETPTMIPKVKQNNGTNTTGNIASIDIQRDTKADSLDQNILLDSLIGEAKQLPRWTNREQVLASNIVNMLTSFVFVARFFNGDLAESEIAAIDTLDSICGVFKGRNFQMVDIALCDVLLQETVVSSTRAELLLKDVSLVLGTAEFVQRALLELRQLLKGARSSLRKEISFEVTENSDKIEDGSPDVHCSIGGKLKRLKLLLLKIDFYFDWATKEMANIQRWTLPSIEFEAQRLRLSSGGKPFITEQSSK